MNTLVLKLRFVICLCLLLMLYCTTALATGPTVRFERLTIENGLSQNSVLTIHQDRQGFMWFGTADGLNRYDGYEFKHFRHDPQDASTLSGNFINVIFEDSQGALWIGTRGSGLNRYDRQKQRFERFTHQLADPNSLSDHFITAIAEDNKGNLWVGTDGGGLNRFNRDTNTFVHFKHQSQVANSLSHNKIRALHCDKKGNLWVGTWVGLNRMNTDIGRFSHFKHLPSDPHSLSQNTVNAMFEDASGTLWIATENGLNRFDDNKQQFKRFKHAPNDPDSLSHNVVSSITEDEQGTLWIGTDGGGLNLLDAKREQFIHYRHQPADTHSLSHNIIRIIYRDSKGLMWVGTFSGIGKVDTDKSHFGHFKHRAFDVNSLSNNNITNIHLSTSETLWVGTNGGGLNKQSGQNHRFEHFKSIPGDKNSLSHNNVSSIVEDSTGTLWVGTFGGGLNQQVGSGNQFKRFRYQKTDPHSLSSDRVQVIYVDSKSRLWVGTGGGGLNRLDASGQFVHFRHQPNNPHSLSLDNVVSIFEDSKGVLWVGTIGGGLNKFDQTTQQFTRYQHDAQSSSSLSHDIVLSIYESAEGTLWMGTYGGGLNKYNAATDDFANYREKEGLANDAVYGILEDRTGHLWLSTNQGLSAFNPKTEKFKNYDVSDGLQSNEFNVGAHFRGADGELFFGGVNGFNRFYPEDIKDDEQPPKVVFTDFLLFNQTVAVQHHQSTSNQIAPNHDRFILPQAIDELPTLTLEHQQSLVSFEFSALDFRSPKKNRYQYKLEGFDENWITVDAKIRRATYTNLPSDSYTLRVKASNPHGYWNEQGASIQIHVKPPLWQSWWAYVFYALVLALCIYWIYHDNMERIKIRNERRKIRSEQRVIERLKQVDKLKDAFLANTSHELRTPLNGIIGLAESLLDGIAGQLPDRANKNLAMVVTSGKRLTHLVNDILDFSKLKHAGIELRPQPLDLQALTDVVLTLSQPLLGDKSLQLINAVGHNLPTVEADEDRLLQIMHNLVGNGIKFTDTGSVTVSAEMVDEKVMISVSDTGIGIVEDKFGAIFDAFEQVQSSNCSYGGTGLGLTVTRQLVELHGSNITVSSELGQGSTFTFALGTTLDNPSIDISAMPTSVEPHHYEPIDASNGYSADLVVNKFQSDFEGSRFKLLLVDDEPINLQVLNNHLALQHYQIVEATDGLQALELIEQSGPFDMVLLDIMMPKLSGYEVCTKIRERYPMSVLPVIFLTAKNQPDDLVQGFLVGANDHLTKPVAKHELLSRVETHLTLLDINRNLEGKVSERTQQIEQQKEILAQQKNDLAQQNQQILATQKKLILSEKLASLGTLMAGVAHEINNPTNFVQLSVQNLEADLTTCRQFIFDLAGEDADPAILDSFARRFDPLQKHISTIIDGTERIKTIVKDLKISTHMDDGKKTTVCITDTLMSTLNLIYAKYEQDVELVTDFTAQPQINCYPAKLNQVFMNLLVNACDALLYKGCEQSKPDNIRGKIIIGCHLKEDFVQITFKDNGCGMTQDTKNNLFEPFFTTKGIEEGTGLGLSISYDIVLKHGGELTVESQLGEGTEFTLTLPISSR